MMEYDKIIVLVFCKDREDVRKYFNLFRLLIGDNAQQWTCLRERCRIVGDRFVIDFKVLNESSRGAKAHYVINLVQDKELDILVAKPLSIIYNYLRNDPKWFELFS